MAHHKEHSRHHRETGGVNDAEEDVKSKPEARTNAKNIDDEAEEKKRGGRARRKSGGGVKHHHVDGDGKLVHKKAKEHSMHTAARSERKRGGKLEGKKHVEMHGEHEKHRADRKPRKDGGRTGSNEHPFSSARHGEKPPGRTEMDLE